MKKFRIGQVVVSCDKEVTRKEATEYITFLQNATKKPLKNVDIKLDGEYVNLHYTASAVIPFQRIRRITGYLTGTVDTWNKAKRAELDDRVKHS